MRKKSPHSVTVFGSLAPLNPVSKRWRDSAPTLFRLLALAGMTAMAGPILIGVLNAPSSRAQAKVQRPQFEVVSIKPNNSGSGRMGYRPTSGRFIAGNVTLKMLIQRAYKAAYASLH